MDDDLHPPGSWRLDRRFITRVAPERWRRELEGATRTAVLQSAE